MASDTPIYKWTVPDGTDPVALFPSQMRTLATQMEDTFFDRFSARRREGQGGVSVSFDSRFNIIPQTGTSAFLCTDVFTDEYDAYRITWLGGKGSGGQQIQLRLAGVTTGYYMSGIFTRPNNTTLSSILTNNGSFFQVGYVTSSPNNEIAVSFDVYTPFQSGMQTSIRADHMEMSNAGALAENYGFVTSTASITAFDLRFNTGTITTPGLVVVYGYHL